MPLCLPHRFLETDCPFVCDDLSEDVDRLRRDNLVIVAQTPRRRWKFPPVLTRLQLHQRGLGSRRVHLLFLFIDMDNDNICKGGGQKIRTGCAEFVFALCIACRKEKKKTTKYKVLNADMTTFLVFVIMP